MEKIYIFLLALQILNTFQIDFEIYQDNTVFYGKDTTLSRDKIIPRSESIKVKFKKAFKNKPDVVIYPIHLDFQQETPQSWNIKVVDVTETDFTYEVKTNTSQEVWSVVIQYLAIDQTHMKYLRLQYYEKETQNINQNLYDVKFEPSFQCFSEKFTAVAYVTGAYNENIAHNLDVEIKNIDYATSSVQVKVFAESRSKLKNYSFTVIAACSEFMESAVFGETSDSWELNNGNGDRYKQYEQDITNSTILLDEKYFFGYGISRYWSQSYYSNTRISIENSQISSPPYQFKTSIKTWQDNKLRNAYISTYILKHPSDCYYKYKTCVDYPTNYQECADGRINPPNCDCPQKYYNKDNVSECQPCSYICGDCENSENDCTICSSDTRNFENECLCNFGFFDVAIEDSCDYKCGDCEQTAPNCTSCASETRNFNNENENEKCKCKEGYFEDRNPECPQCSYKCGTCENQAENCQTCSSATRDIDKNCQCKDGYFDNGKAECQPCSYICETCEYYSTNCLTCSGEDTRLDYNWCNCKQGFYDSGEKQCQPCDYSVCETCFGSSTNCTKCKFNQFVKPNCTSCQLGYYFNSTLNSCETCRIGCLTCSHYLECDTCISPTIDPPTCIAESQLLMKNSQGLISIFTCDIQCKTCIEQTYNCVICNENRINPPNCECEAGYHDSYKSLKNCAKCQDPCSTCTTYQYCTSCKDENKIAQGGNCVCPKKHILVDNQCQKCPENHYINDNKCYLCLYYLDVCVKICPDYTFVQGNQCIYEAKKNEFGTIFLYSVLALMLTALAYAVYKKYKDNQELDYLPCQNEQQKAIELEKRVSKQ